MVVGTNTGQDDLLFNLAFPQEMSKKMLPKAHKQEVFSVHNTDFVKQYTMPVLREGAVWYIEFYAFDPAISKLRRKRIKINRIKGATKKRAYARDVMRRITQQLSEGWNPWIEKDCTNLMTIAEVMSSYEAFVDKMFCSGNYRKQTYASYKSYIKNFEDYIEKNSPIYYLYQLDKAYITRFLDHIFIERDNGARTRNNYLSWLAVFCGWCKIVNVYVAESPGATSPVELIVACWPSEYEIVPPTAVPEVETTPAPDVLDVSNATFHVDEIDAVPVIFKVVAPRSARITV